MSLPARRATAFSGTASNYEQRLQGAGGGGSQYAASPPEPEDMEGRRSPSVDFTLGQSRLSP